MGCLPISQRDLFPTERDTQREAYKENRKVLTKTRTIPGIYRAISTYKGEQVGAREPELEPKRHPFLPSAPIC